MSVAEVHLEQGDTWRISGACVAEVHMEQGYTYN